jgi:predicted dehydrogenase
MRVGVIGTGFGQRVVAPAFAATAGCEVTGVVSARDREAVQELFQRADVDLVSVHSPPFLHQEHVRLAIEARKAVLCDKPFAVNMSAPETVALCNFEFRFAPARQRLRELVRAGSLGTIEHVQWTHVSSGSRVPLRPWGWLFDRELGGGWIGAWASHAVDTIRWIFGEITEVQSRPRIDIKQRPDRDGVMRECTAEDGVTASLVLASGVTVAIDSTFAASASLAPRLHVLGSDAVCELVADSRLTLRNANGVVTEEHFEVDGDHHNEPMRRFAAAVRDSVAAGDAVTDVPTFADGLACDRVLDLLRAPLA